MLVNVYKLLQQMTLIKLNKNKTIKIKWNVALASSCSFFFYSWFVRHSSVFYYDSNCWSISMLEPYGEVDLKQHLINTTKITAPKHECLHGAWVCDLAWRWLNIERGGVTFCSNELPRSSQQLWFQINLTSTNEWP